MARLKELYENEIKKSLKESLKIKNDMAVPKIRKNYNKYGSGKSI